MEEDKFEATLGIYHRRQNGEPVPNEPNIELVLESSDKGTLIQSASLADAARRDK